jgi:[ribosomal protein S18]-alanine N-acetyltransferase
VILRRSDSPGWRLYSLAVHPDRRRAGLARALLEEVHRAADASAVDWIRLEVRPDNAAAIVLYDALGYAAIGSRTGYYEDGSDALRMERRR